MVLHEGRVYVHSNTARENLMPSTSSGRRHLVSFGLNFFCTRNASQLLSEKLPSSKGTPTSDISVRSSAPISARSWSTGLRHSGSISVRSSYRPGIWASLNRLSARLYRVYTQRANKRCYRSEILASFVKNYRGLKCVNC